MVHIIKSHKSHKAEYKYIRDTCQQEKPTGITMTLSANNSLESDSLSFSIPIIACLTVHIPGQGIKKKTSKKVIKTKEFSYTFSATKANYLKFLVIFLSKHHISNKLQVMNHRHYTLKMQVPPSA